jgi:hypothetical protein
MDLNLNREVDLATRVRGRQETHRIALIRLPVEEGAREREEGKPLSSDLEVGRRNRSLEEDPPLLGGQQGRVSQRKIVRGVG